MSSGHPRVANCDAATLDANVSPIHLKLLKIYQKNYKL